MRRLAFVGLIAVCAALAAASTAAASGPAAPGKDVIQIDCGSAGTFWVSVPNQDHDNNGVGQIVGEKGHGIPVSFTFTVSDATTNTVLFSDSNAVGKGHAHPNQATTPCSFQPFPDTVASDFFGEDLPPGVAPTDIISGTATVGVIIKR
jgi:hypothetical protein